jgi:hypothetical protein
MIRSFADGTLVGGRSSDKRGSMLQSIGLVLRVVPWLALAASVTGCSRSPLEASGSSPAGSANGAGSGGAPSGSGGSGGAPSGSGGAQSGSGGMGGGAPACTQLVQTGDLLRLTPEATVAFAPRLHSLGNGQMALVYTLAVPGMGMGAVLSTTLAWTKDWPPPATAPVELIDRPAYAAGVGHDTAKGIALLAIPDGKKVGRAFGFADPQKGGWSQVVTTDEEAFGSAFIAEGTSGNFFVGMAASAGPDIAAPHVGWVGTNGAPDYVGPIDLGCPIHHPLKVRAVGMAGGWMLVRNVTKNDCKPGSATKLRVMAFAGEQPQVGVELEFVGYPEPFGLAPRPGGAWLLYYGQIEGFWAAGLDVLGQIEVGPVKLASPYDLVQSFAADAALGGLLLVYPDVSSDPPIQLKVVLMNEQGQPITSAPLTGVPISSDMQIAFDEATRQALFAVSMQDETGYFSVGVARFSCQ